MGTKDFDIACDDYMHALKFFPNNKNIRDELNLAKKSQLNYLSEEKKLFTKMFR